MEDIGCYLDPHSTVRELPYWGIFPLSAGSRAVFQVAGLRLLVLRRLVCCTGAYFLLGLSFKAKI